MVKRGAKGRMRILSTSASEYFLTFFWSSVCRNDATGPVELNTMILVINGWLVAVVEKPISGKQALFKADSDGKNCES